MRNNPETKPTWAKVPINLLDDIDFLELSESPDPIAVYFMGLLLAKESGAGGTVMIRNKPASLKNLAYSMGYYGKEEELKNCLLKLDKAGYVRYENEILFYPDYAILQVMSVAETKILYDGICQSIYTHRFNKTETSFDKVLMIPYQTIYKKIGKEKILSILDSPSEEMARGLENLYKENYDANLVKAIMIELQAKFINDENKFEEILNLIGDDYMDDIESPPQEKTPSETLPEPPSERTGEPEGEKSGGRRQLSFEESRTRHRIKNKNFSMVYNWFQNNLKAFDVIFKGENINRVKNAFVDYASDGHNGTFAEFLNKYDLDFCDDHESQRTLEALDDSIDLVPPGATASNDNDDDDNDDDNEFEEYPF